MKSSILTKDHLLCELRDTQDLEARWRLFERLWHQCEKIVDRKLNILNLAGFTPEGTDSKYFIEEAKQLVSLKLWKSARLYRGSFFDAFLRSIVESCAKDLRKEIKRLGRRVVGVVKMRELAQGLRRCYEEEEEIEDQLVSELAYRSVHYVVPYGFDPSKLVDNRETKRIVTLALALYTQKDVKKNRNSVKAVMWRYRKGLTNKEIAALFLVTERTIERWINDHDLPGIQTTLAESFGITRLADIL
jgi:DNA-directed RNA polymerase specialized sigma24 family protein